MTCTVCAILNDIVIVTACSLLVTKSTVYTPAGGYAGATDAMIDVAIVFIVSIPMAIDSFSPVVIVPMIVDAFGPTGV